MPGGGISGLFLASRLSEDSSMSVLVLEAGASGDDPEGRAPIGVFFLLYLTHRVDSDALMDDVDTSSGSFFTSIVGTQYDWAHQTVPQGKFGGRVIGLPRGKDLGGSTEMNVMYLVRLSSVEMDAWAELLGGMDDNGSDVSKLAIHAHSNG
ncbi:hypothetical protein BDQ17DRAFT_1385108 [Cyathus striatus]|nr:hypothetical protein BDQ17DRAFT_1385108 [Cyathus striatus]